ncbi:MAG: 2Fe-2S iron-sulfur cluster-binding protein [Lautropia sp.]
MQAGLVAARVQAIRYEAKGIVSVELVPLESGAFHSFTAGSHVDLHLPNGVVRSYSLCNPAGETRRYQIAVAHDRASRGGSRFVHEQLRVGATIRISPPRNHFPLVESAPHHVLVAGGIGITPLWCMFQRLVAIGASVDLVYCSRSRHEAAFADAIEALAEGAGRGDAATGGGGGGRRASVRFLHDDREGGPPDLNALLGEAPPDAHVYCCGPAPMLEAFEAACARLGLAHAHVERFAAREQAHPSIARDAFVVVCARSDRSVEVASGETILDKVLAAGIHADHSCREGVCGACETTVIEGSVDHRDSLLSDQERAAGKTMMICCSLAAGERLVLDL